MRPSLRQAPCAGTAMQMQASMAAVLDHLPVGVVLIDPAGRIRHVNRAALAMFGAADASDLVGKPCHGTLCELGCCSVLDPAESTASYEAEALRADGTRIDVLKSAIRLDLNGERLLLESFIDITERKEAEEVRRRSEARFKTLFEHAGDAIMIHDREGRLLDVNQEACARLGYTRRELLAMTLTDVEAADAPPAPPAEAADRPAVYATAYLRRDGRRLPVEVSARAFDFAGRPAVLSIARDITERLQAERQLQQAKEAAEASNRAKGDFLARMSHEVRTPINGVIGMTQLAMEAESAHEQAEYLHAVKESADSLLAIVNDILDFSKIEAGKVHLDLARFSLRRCVASAVRSLAAPAEAKGLELLAGVDAGVPDTLVGDAGRIRQILVNLVGNALKFTDEGQVALRVVADEVAAGAATIHLAVADTGIGISPDKQRTIFEAFEQADGSTTRRYGGTGLGLAITSDLAALMGGRVWVESEPGRGATFHVTLRLARPDAADEPAWLTRTDLRDMPVLVVDDNATGREFLLAALAQWDMRPMPAADGCDAMAKLRAAAAAGDPFGLVLLDADLAGADGFAVADAVARDAALDAPVIMMFHPARWQDVDDRLATGTLAAHVTRPVDPEQLSEAISKALNRPGRAQPPAASPRPAPRALHVLVAEDNRVNQVLLERLLKRRGHRVTVAADGAAALDAWRAGGIDVVLADLHMPALDGPALAAAIRRAEGLTGRRTPIVAMTADATADQRGRCLAAGMDAH
ncbi:MAG: PAS domain S-box protein, partial [Planctomycetes bacterium]|nr:PAS domain S-box protein [Planctomycetota bacterium]